MDLIEFTAEQYVDDVLSGKIITCRWVKLACERHRDDLETGHERGLWFDEEAAEMVIAFFHILEHWKGEWAGQFIKLEPAQQFWLWNLFGWKNDDGTRRFTVGYLEVARKNTKTTLAAGIALYLAFIEGEPGAEVYSAATKKEQAKICHNDATQMVKRSKCLQREKIKVFRNNLSLESLGSKFEPLASDYGSLDGLNISGAICDELHAWKSDELWGVIETATGSRRQSLIFAITTAGTNTQGICYRQREYLTRILKGIITDDSYWGMIYTIDTKKDWPDLEQDDDWQDPNNWIKANPLLGVSKKLRKMMQEAKKAANIPTQLNQFLRWHLNVWTQAITRWVNPIHWASCGQLEYSEESLEGRRCLAGLDLAQVYDLAALILYFPPDEEGEPDKILCRFWLPEDNMEQRVKRDQVPYDVWADQGYITLTPGNIIDYDYIEAEILELAKLFNIDELGYDPWKATQIITNLQDVMGQDWPVEVRQGMVTMSKPTTELGIRITGHKLAHGNNPVLNWMADNMVVRTDPHENIKPDKEKSREKIDGMVALIMALDRAMRHKINVYEERDLLVL